MCFAHRIGNSEISQGSVCLRDSMFGVGKKLKIQTLFYAEVLVRIDAVQAHTQNGGFSPPVVLKIALKVVGFNGAAAGEVLGIEIEDHPLAAKIAQAHRFSVLRS